MEYNKKRTKRSYYNTQLLNQKGRKISVKKPTTASQGIRKKELTKVKISRRNNNKYQSRNKMEHKTQ
jgi:hypothetical protein